MKNKKEKNKLKPENRNQQGITLIALVITIIVLLILAGVSIAMLTGQNGILTQANNSKIEQSHGAVKEAISLAYNEWQIEINTGSRTKLASTETVIINGEEKKAKAGTEETFLQFLESKGYIKEGTTDILNVEKLTGSKQALGNGETTDVYKIEEQDGEYVVNYIDEKNGKRQIWNVKNETEQDQSNIYTYTEEGYITGIKPEYFKNNTYGEVGKIASTENIKTASALLKFYLIDELNGTLVIPNQIQNRKIIGISERAFAQIMNLKKVIISEGIISMGDEAFHYCEELNDISLPDSLQDIGGWTFDGCKSLKSITIPENVKSIGEYAFQSCNNLEKITIIRTEEGIISGQPWGAYGTQIIYKDKYSAFAENYVLNMGRTELENLCVKSMLYPGTFDEMLKESGETRKEIEMEAESEGMTYEEYLKEVLTNRNRMPFSWIVVEYNSEANGWNEKNKSELEQLFLDTAGQSVDEFLLKNNLKTKEEILTKYSEEEILKFCLNYVISTNS